MRTRRTTVVTTAALAVAAAAVVGGVTVAASNGNSPTYTAASGTTSHMGSAPANSSGKAVIRTATATVEGTTERILVDAKGDPLYIYKPDTATKSLVAGQLAVLWPPLVGSSATANGASGSLTTVATTNGRQVAYNGHFLYTFVQDKPGTVTGQGVQDFFVATPDLPTLASTGGSTAPSPAGNGYY
jgi:predicted lipoprotein with Yx(FWY)xxD motif